jgi:hypothetical protein
MTERHDIRKEVRMSAEETVELMHTSQRLGISESDVMRMAFRLFIDRLDNAGLLKSTGVLTDVKR